MSDAAARQILIAGARALAHADGLGASLQILLASLAEQLEVESAAIVVVDEQGDRFEIAASIGLPDSAVAGLAAAIANPGHPISRTVATPVSSFDVLPTAPGGPALRSHLPLIVTRDGSDIVLGVLALAHDRPIGPWSAAAPAGGRGSHGRRDRARPYRLADGVAGPDEPAMP